MSFQLTEQNITIIKGQALDIDITVTDSAGDAADLSAASATFGIATSKNAAYTQELDTTIASNVITAELTSAISAALTAGVYYFSAWVLIGSDWTPVAYGQFIIRSDSRTA